MIFLGNIKDMYTQFVSGILGIFVITSGEKWIIWKFWRFFYGMIWKFLGFLHKIIWECGGIFGIISGEWCMILYRNIKNMSTQLVWGIFSIFYNFRREVYFMEMLMIFSYNYMETLIIFSYTYLEIMMNF